MEFFHLLKASQKSGKKDAVIWFTAKSEARAALQLDVELEEAGIETGRGKDYAKPIRTDLPVCNDLPEEGTIDYTWCERYELQDDGRTWLPKAAAENTVKTTVETVETTDNTTTIEQTMPESSGIKLDEHDDETTRYPVVQMPFRKQLLAQLTGDELRHHLTREEFEALGVLEMDTDNSYVQNLLLAAESCPEVKGYDTKDLWRYTEAVGKVFSQDKRHELALVLRFTKIWVTTDYIDRGILAREWAAGNRISDVQRTDTGTNADGGFITDRGEGAHHTLDTLDLEIACALLPMDFNHLEIPGSIHRRAKDIVASKEQPWKSWSAILRNQPGILSVNRAAIFNLVRIAPENIHLTPVAHLEFINQTMTAEFNAATELVTVPAPAAKSGKAEQPVGGGKTDRNPNYKHDFDGLDTEIALATLSTDFNIYDIPSEEFRQAKAIVAANYSPFKEWSEALRATPGILDYSRAAIFALIRSAFSGIHFEPKHIRGHIHANLTETDHEHPTAEMLAAARHTPEVSWESEVNQKLAAEQHVLPKWVEAGEQKLADEDEAETQNLPKWAGSTASQPQVAKLGGGMFSIDGLMGGNTDPVINNTSNEVEKTETVTETTSNVQMEEAQPEKVEVTYVVSPSESADAAAAQTDALNSSEVLAAAAPSMAYQEQADVNQNAENAHQDDDSAHQNTPKVNQIEPETHQAEPEAEYPAYFEPGRYEGLPNNVYHAANGISSTQVKDARVSLMYFNARHVAKTIPREGSKVLDMGNLVHALALQPENLHEEFSVEPVIPEGAFTTAATLRAFIDEYNATLPALLSADDIKALLEEHNATLPAQVPLGAGLEETAQSYMALPAEFQRIAADQKQTAAAMKACIKEYNATLPSPVKTSGSRDALLEQLAIINPDLVAQEAQKPAPLKVSGTKAEMIQAVKSVKPDAVFADELLDAWRENPGEKILVTQQQMQTALAIQKALHEHPTAGKLLLHPDRAVETSYFGIDEETGLEIRVRPDLEIDIDAVRIGADLKTISMWNVKQSGLRARLHREIIDRDYHLSAAMYMNTAALDQFFWIFVNKDEGYHWIAIVEASEELIELGMLEYRQTMNRIANAFDTGVWPAPITEDYTDELNDFDLRRLEALRTQA
ncbi:TPA: RecE family exodeoxyribonuclease [Escherichia coli]